MTSPWTILGALALAHFVAVASPGPNNAFIFQVASRSRRDALIAALGIWPAGAIWAALGLAGVGALTQAEPRLALLLRVGGGLFLCWLGWRMIFRRRSGPAEKADLSASSLSLFAAGFLTNFLNPKAIAYYTSIFAAVGAYELTAPWRAVAIIGMPGIGFLWYAGISLVISSEPGRRVLARIGAFIDYAAGGLMIAFGLSLLARA